MGTGRATRTETPWGHSQGQGQAGDQLSAGWIGSGSFWPFLIQAGPENQFPLLPACFQVLCWLLMGTRGKCSRKNAGSLQGLGQQFHP